MTVQEAWNRGNNLVATAILGLAGFAFFPELFLETEHTYKIDEALIFLLGLGTIVWYVRGKNKFKRSLLPVMHMWAAFAVKIMGLVIEFKDKEDVGDDFGALILFLLAGILVTFLYVKGKKMLQN